MSAPLKYLLWILLFYSAYCCLLFIMQRKILFPVGYTGNPSGTRIKIPGLEKIWLNIKSGKTEAWYIPPSEKYSSAPSPIMIFAPGNAELIDYSIDEFLPLTHQGLGILLVEYPGYGRSEGSPSQKSITEVYVKAYDLMASRKDIDPNKIILCGRSIGGGVACALAAQRPSAALILISTFKSVKSFTIRYLVPSFLVRDPFDNLKVVKNYQKPILIIHGKYDDMIPYSHGETLAKNAVKGTLLSYNCAHNDCPPDHSIFLNDILLFLKKSEIL